MRTLPAVLLIGAVFAPTAWTKQTNRPAIKLIASIDTAAPEEQPILVIDFVNQSGHVLRIPEPPLLCDPAPGALSLEVKFTPENTNQARPLPDCGLEVDGRGLADIRDRAKDWQVLKSGQDFQVRRPLAMGVDTSAEGTYELHVIYDGPSASPDDDQKLKDAGIAVPSGRVESDKLTYKVNSPKQ